MMNSDQRMVETQARIISELNRDIAEKNNKIEELNVRLSNHELAGKFYLEMQKVIMDNPTLKSEWDNFCVVLKMVCPEMDEILEEVVKKHKINQTTSYAFVV